ncbi:hypothetical protein DVH24_042365 [Malus domestica]|uniref:Uncharacterized protein n=1 Tax=Malus domestica TaxID=3750 RepID=A0A498J1R1_MALDO|nr:hypothetical protein DVH24_042365 [Malus domestica]
MAGSNGNNLRSLVFNGQKFDFWQIKIKTNFRSYELWNFVENGVETLAKKEEELTTDEKKLRSENAVKDASGIIQNAISD